MAESVAEQLGEECEDRALLLWGAQGPDLLFYVRPYLPWKKEKTYEFGLKIHRGKPSEYFEAIKRYISKHYEALPYMYGAISHYALDSVIHPFVYSQIRSFSKKYRSPHSFLWHGDIETSLDIILLRHKLRKLPCEFRLRTAIPDTDDVDGTVGDINGFVVKEMYDKELDKNVIKNIAGDVRRSFSLIDNGALVKKPLLEFAEKMVGKAGVFTPLMRGISENGDIDYGNLCRNCWKLSEEGTATSDNDIFGIFETAEKYAMRIIEGYHSGLPFSELTDGMSFNGKKILPERKREADDL